MKKSKFSEEQIATALRQVDAGALRAVRRGASGVPPGGVHTDPQHSAGLPRCAGSHDTIMLGMQLMNPHQ